MVEDTREKAGPGALRPIGLPQPIEVRVVPNGWPVAVRAGHRWLMAQIVGRWRIDDEWWREQPVSRMYFEIVLENGHHWVIFQDLIGNIWFRQNQG
ncbi:MAG: hypothetical protein HY664_03650 [Chloroflexi bacterium]|nr:hypothetical protein [Chloroflexota bacterium]